MPRSSWGPSVTVRVHRCANSSMTKEFLRDPGMDAVAQEHRRATMPEIVKPDPGHAGPLDHAPEVPHREIVCVERLPVRLTEDEIMRRM